MAGHQRFVGVARERIEDLRVFEHEREQAMLPIAASHRVKQEEVAERGTLKQESAQGDSPADVGRDDARGLELPMLEQLREPAALSSKAQVLTFALLRSAVAELIEEEDLTTIRERRDDRAPDHRPVRRAVHENDG